jgi:LCP family protein required for cell wall assembly
MGIDTREDDSTLGRTDTLIMMHVNPLRPDVGMLSIPRDLWVTIPNVGENRINTAHFFAEANAPGSGPQAVLDTVEHNFDLRFPYYARVRFSGVRGVIEAMGGIDVEISEPTGGLEPGKYHLNGEQALAFARDRAHGDDFGRMKQGQIVILAAARRMLLPWVWPRIPEVIAAFFSSVDTNLPIWQWPRLVLAIARAGDDLDHRAISRDEVIPFTTDQGAQVLAPNWELINPMLLDIFGP